LTRSAHDAEDLVQSTLERLWALRGAALPVHALALLAQTIVRRLAIDRARKAARWQLIERPVAMEVAPTELAAAGSGEAEARGSISPAELSAALERCAPLDRQAFELHYVHGLRYTDIASRLGIAMGTVATRLHRARAQLRSELGPLRGATSAQRQGL
jgi:RNA polymerase sigma-70 factor (ECF subfamily)